MSFAVGRGAFGCRVFQLDGGDYVTGLRIERGESADGAAVIGQNDLVVGLVVHDAVEALADLDLLDYRQRFQIEHGDGAIAAIRCKAVTSLGGDARAMHARRVGNVAEHFAGGAFHHHHVAGTRNEHAPRGGFGGHIVGASVALDVELLNLERLRVPGGRG